MPYENCPICNRQVTLLNTDKDILVAENDLDYTQRTISQMCGHSEERINEKLGENTCWCYNQKQSCPSCRQFVTVYFCCPSHNENESQECQYCGHNLAPFGEPVKQEKW